MEVTHITYSLTSQKGDSVSKGNFGIFDGEYGFKTAFTIGERVQLIRTILDNRCDSHILAIVRRPNGQMTSMCYSYLRPL